MFPGSEDSASWPKPVEPLTGAIRGMNEPGFRIMEFDTHELEKGGISAGSGDQLTAFPHNVHMLESFKHEVICTSDHQ
jgi:hypothetical protein